jgi:hypothetical protein
VRRAGLGRPPRGGVGFDAVKELVQFLGTVHAELRIAARAPEELSALHELPLDIVVRRSVVGGPHLVPLVAVPMKQPDLIDGEHRLHPPLQVSRAG